MDKESLKYEIDRNNQYGFASWCHCARCDATRIELTALIESSEEAEPQEVVELKLSDEDKSRIEKKVAEFKKTHGEGAEVGDFTEQTLAWFNSFVKWARKNDREWHEGNDEAAKTIRALIRQPRRTVSRAERFVEHIENHLNKSQTFRQVRCEFCGKDIDEINAELGYEIEEPKKEGEGK